MNRFIALASLVLALLLVSSALAVDNLHTMRITQDRAWTPADEHAGKAMRDTIYLMGGPDLPNTGDFEGAGGGSAWNGWQHEDHTAPSVNHWHVDTYHMEPLHGNGAGNLGAWCGSIGYPACPNETEPGGYGNDWGDGLDYWGTVDDNGVNTTVDIEFWYNLHTETGWDWFNVNVDRGGTWEQIEHTSSVFENLHFIQTVTFLPEDYVNGNEFHIQLEITSDGNTSDIDCLWPGTGAVQVDDITISGSNGVATYFEDFEGGSLGSWVQTLPQGAGDFTQLWSNLDDLVICNSNFTTQVAFIDDGQVVPGVGPSECVSWCYGPNGWVVNFTGGALGGEDDHIWNWVYSPPLEWPAGDYDGAHFLFNVYRHEEIYSDISTGIFYLWGVRSVATGDPADLEFAPWVWDGWYYYGSAAYLDSFGQLSGGLTAGRTHVQVRLGAYEWGWVLGYDGVDGTPAPYFDNIRVLAYPFEGPGINTRELEMAQDAFPDRGIVDYDDLASNWCRFDAAQNIAPQEHLWNDPGDSITFDIAPVRAGATMTEVRMFYKIKPNLLFDGVRMQAPGANGFIEGFVDADTAVYMGLPVAGTWAIDMPDTGFFFPGDVMHYYIKATDDTGGNPLSSFAPPDTSGFSDFHTIMGYKDFTQEWDFNVRFLPTVFSETIGDHPKILWWNDWGMRTGQNTWYYALANNGFLEGIDFDTYYTNSPSSGVGNGLGRWSAAVLAGYDTILYRSGTGNHATISNGDPASDPGKDVGVLDTWLQDGDRNMFLTGDNLANDLAHSGSATLAFLNNWIGVDHQTGSILDFIDNQTAPTVSITPANPVFATVDEWIAFGGCPFVNRFDGVTKTTAERVAEFLNPQGQGGSYPYAAATYHDLDAFNDQIIYLPYDLQYVHTVPGNTGNSARAKVLADVLLTFNHIGGSPVTPVSEIGVFAVKNYPNPFNPQTKIEFTLPQRGQVSVKIFNVRGELVRTVFDGVREGNVVHVAVWSGIDDRGAAVSSGVYFYEIKTNGMTKINKMALVR